jgi:hypothetical protein
MWLRAADALVIVWWIAAVVAVPWTLLLTWRGWRRDQFEKQKIALAALNGGSLKRMPVRSMPKILIFLLIIVFVFFFVFFWLHALTWLQVINLYASLCILSLFFAAAGVAPYKVPLTVFNFRLAPFSVGEIALRILFLAMGLGGLWWTSTTLFRDLAYPWQVVEGHVDSMRWRARKTVPEFKLTLDRHVHDVTYEVYENVSPGDVIRAEFGAGSGTIFKAELLHRPPPR